MSELKKSSAPEKAAEQPSMLAIVRVRGGHRKQSSVSMTLSLLNLHKQNYCVLVPDTPSIRGMIMKVKDYVTYGPASQETIGLLSAKAEPHPRKKDEKKTFYRLQPPLKGYGRTGIKRPFNKSGALGQRNHEINALIKRMVR